MHEQSKIPTVRNLDGVYYRVVRDGNHVSRCFSDLSESEQDMIMEKYDAEQLRRLCRCLCISLRQIGDALFVDLCETLQRVIPILWQRQHLREQTLGFEGQRMVAEMVVGHNRVTFGLFNTEYRHFCNLLRRGFEI